MDIVTIPQDLFIRDGQPPPTERTAIRLYNTPSPSAKTRVKLNKNLFSFLLEGEKTIHRPGNTIRVTPRHFLLIAGGNSLMSEKLSTNGRYRSLLLFFDDSVLADFFAKYKTLLQNKGAFDDAMREPVVCFESDEFISNYLCSLQLILESKTTLLPELQTLKFEELMLYLANRYPQTLASFQVADDPDVSDRQLITTVESNIQSPVTVEDLAFLCNTSLSTFKRRFARIYGTSPNKWILQKKMELAATLLQHHEKPSEVYYKVGYENHSSFTHTFKQIFGLTPSEFQQQGSRQRQDGQGAGKLNVYPWFLDGQPYRAGPSIPYFCTLTNVQ